MWSGTVRLRTRPVCDQKFGIGLGFGRTDDPGRQTCPEVTQPSILPNVPRILRPANVLRFKSNLKLPTFFQFACRKYKSQDLPLNVGLYPLT